MSYEESLLAAGFPPDQVARDVHANEMRFWRNREMPQYGKTDEDEQEQ